MSTRVHVLRLSVCLAAALAASVLSDAKVIYVALSGDGSTGASWATAFTSPSDAVAAAGSNDSIYIAEGTYSIGAPISVPSDLAILGGFKDPSKGIALQNAAKYVTALNDDGAAGSILICNGVTNVSIAGLVFTGCTGSGASYGRGGAIRCESGADVLITDCTFKDNVLSGSAYGAGVNIIGANATIKKSSFRNNFAQEGGGVKVHSGTAAISRCVFEDNEANLIGGAFSAYNSDTEIDRCVFLGNIGPYGGAVECHEGTRAKFADCLFARNSASAEGGGLCFTYQDGIVIVSCTVAANESTGDGGGLFLNDSSASVVNSIFFKNKKFGIFEFDANSDPVVQNCMFYFNRGGAYFNEGTQKIEDASGPGGMNSVLAEASGNLDGNPKFADHTRDDYHLTRNSPAIDAGTFSDETGRDIDADLRPISLVKVPAGYDIGYDEYNPLATISVKKPENGETWERGKKYAIKWRSDGYTGSHVSLELLQNGSVAAVINADTANDGKLRWKVPNDVPANTGYTVRIKDIDDKTFSGSSAGSFEIVEP